MYDSFTDIIAKQFNNIKIEFERRSYNLFNEWNEDLFMDAYIKCSEVLNNKQLTKTEYLKYFWTSYANSFKTSKTMPQHISIDDPNRGEIVSMSDRYNYEVDILYGDILNSVKEKFGNEYANAWVEHINGKTYKDLEFLGYNFKFNDIFKKIVKWVRENYKGRY